MQTINTGTTANDFTGDGLRSAMVKVNSNFSELDIRGKNGYLFIGPATTTTVPPVLTESDRVYYFIDCPASATTLTLANFGGLVIPILTVPTRYNVKWNGEAWNAVSDIVLTSNNIKASLTESVTGNTLDATMGKTLADAVSAIISDEKAVAPQIAFYKRVVADSGTVNTQIAERIYDETQAKNASLYYLLSGAYKSRTSGLNQYVTKVYDFSLNNNDASNATGITDAFLDGYIVPKANLGIKYVAGQTQTGVLTFGTALTKLATDSWTLRAVLKANIKGSVRIALGVASYLEINATTIVLHNGTVALLTGTYTVNSGLKGDIEFQYGGGAVGLIKVNGLPIVTVALSGTMDFSKIAYLSANKFDGTIYHFSVFPYRCSEAESVKETAFLKSVFPDAETVVINGYEITTQNAENIVAVDGTSVPEVRGATTDGNAELYPILNLESVWTTYLATIIDSNTFTTSGAGGIFGAINLSANKAYRVVISGTSTATIRIENSTGAAFANYLGSTTGDFNISCYVKGASASSLYIGLNASGQISITSLSVKEVGVSDSTNVYDYVYAATSGSVNVKTLAAQKAAAAYCLYNNDPLLGAIYGKLYNWYAAALLAPKGWHLMSSAEWTQIITALGGSTVAGGKLKAKFGGFDNANASNESGFSAIAGGTREEGTWSFSNIGVAFTFYTSDGYRANILNSNTEISSLSNALSKTNFRSLRLFSNTPHLLTDTYTSGLFSTDIASSPKSIRIPFNSPVKTIKIKSTTSLTSIEAKLYSYDGVELETLITGKGCSVTTKSFNVTVDQTMSYTDSYVRVTATGNSGVGMEIEIII